MTDAIRRGFWLAATYATAALPLAGQAFAQPGARAEEPETVVVTATRRESALQDVPIAVTPVTAELVRNSGVRDIQDLVNVAPGLQFNVSENETSATARLRGIGTQGSNPGLESAVGVFIDGVYRARNGVALTELGEISQIEVMRGPQGTLFGRNTSAGLISVSTAGPDLTEGGFGIEGTLGDFGERRIAAFATGPIVTDKFGVRLFAASSQRDGFNDVIDETGAVSDMNDRNLWTVRGQALIAPSAQWDLRIIADYTERDEACCGAVFYDPASVNGATGEGYVNSPPARALAAIGGFGPDGVAALGASDFSDRIGFSDRDTTQELREGGLSAELNVMAGPGVFTSVTAYRDWDFIQGQDIDFTAADLLYRAPGDGGFGFQTLSQEFRYAARSGPLDWLVGLYYSDEGLTRRDTIRIGSDYGEYFGALDAQLGGAIPDMLVIAAGRAEGGGQRDRYTQDGQSIAAFTHNIWSIGPRTELTFGARITDETKDFRAVRATFGVIPGTFTWHNPSLDGVRTASRDENEWSGVVSLRQELTDMLSGYVSFARGYKSGGFNLDRDLDGDPSFDAEFADSWEIGAKSAWFDGDLVLNGAVYSAQYQDYQLNRFNGVSFVVSSIPEVETRGAELDMIWRLPVAGLSMQGGVAYNDAQYGEFAAGNDPGLARLPNSRLTNSPLWTITDAVTYEWNVSPGLQGLAYLDARYVSEQNTGSDLDPAKIQEAYVLLNGRIGLMTESERYAFEIWGRNLLDEEYGQVMFDAPLQFLRPVLPVNGLRGAFLGDPRTYGVTVRARY